MVKTVSNTQISRKLKYVCAAACITILVVIIVVVTVILTRKSGKTERFSGAAVSNGPGCSDIAINIMSKGGTVADAAIAALFCEGVVMPQSMGLGGGFLLTLYKKDTGEAISLNSREVAPAAATRDMFGGNATLSLNGGLSVAVPGELRGYWELYEKYGGGVSWKDIIKPSIDLCNNGIPITEYVDYVLRSNKDKILSEPQLINIFVDPKTNELYKQGDVYTRPLLGATLTKIAEEGGDTLHNGSLTSILVKDIQNRNGIITIEDMNNYRPKWQTPINLTLTGGHKLYSQPLPGSGVVVAMILNILDNFLDIENQESIENYQKIVETFKFSYAKRSLLGDQDFVPLQEILDEITSTTFAEQIRKSINITATSTDTSYYGGNYSVQEDHGTANLCILAPNGDAIAVTSTINYIFGGMVSESTGIILNDQMDDFSSDNIINVYNLPPSPANYIEPRKQPLSSMSPSIVVDANGDVVMAVGGAGGSKIITSIAQVIVRHLWYGTELQAASNFKRFHHQLWPMQVDLEPLFETEAAYIAEGLKEIGHEVVYVDGRGFAAVTCVSTRNAGSVTGAWDIRRSGSVTYL
ncbi:scoloptoxin SSD14 isoform X1 [Diorhabda carinulata]|uniref:scoloptoxin SSD14 isoform X1 n=1 Tax=Diorhabda carinulata TaxID=1163345 RepID=UPI0025A0E9D4|nr:scoloptoxin SSD14 isoform X1 [Diorhabda carinulata]